MAKHSDKNLHDFNATFLGNSQKHKKTTKEIAAIIAPIHSPSWFILIFILFL
jgi:hypothetical protein